MFKKIIVMGSLIMALVVPHLDAATFYAWRYREHATDCTALTDGKLRDLCYEIDADTFYKCEPSAGDCSGAEWKPLNTTGNASTATLATTVTVSDDESTDDAHEVAFTTDNANLESDGDFNYNPSSGKLSVPALLMSGLTASEILGTDASKNLVSLSVATYPSLTELTYLKGVTSALQTQLNTKEVQLDNEAGLYAVLSDVSDFVQGGEANSIDSDMYVDGSIDTAHYAAGSVDADAMGADSVGESELIEAMNFTATGVWDFGGGVIELTNSATPTTDATGEIALDTMITDHQPLLQYFDGGENMTIIAIDTAELPATDNEIVKYDAAADKFVLEADAGGSAATTFSWTLRPQQAKLPSSDPMAIDAGNSRWRGLFDDTATDESATWETVLYPYQGGTLAAKIFYTLETTSSSDVAAFDLLIDCRSDTDTAFDTDSYGTTNSIDSASQSLTAGVLDVLTDTSLNEDSCAENDHISVKVFRDVSADGVTDDIELRKVLIYEV